MKKNKKILKIVGSNIRHIRNSIKISQEQLGFLCNLDRTYISDVELGKWAKKRKGELIFCEGEKKALP